MIKSNPIPTRWVTHNLQKNNNREVPPLLGRFGTPRQASQPGDLTKELGIPRESHLEGHRDLIIRFPQDWGARGKQRLILEGMNKTLQAPRLRGKEQQPYGRLNQETCQCWKVSCGGVGGQGLITGTGALAAVLESPPWCKPSWRSPLTLPQSP